MPGGPFWVNVSDARVPWCGELRREGSGWLGVYLFFGDNLRGELMKVLFCLVCLWFFMDSTKGKSPVNYHHHLFFFPTLGKSKNGQVFEHKFSSETWAKVKLFHAFVFVAENLRSETLLRPSFWKLCFQVKLSLRDTFLILKMSNCGYVPSEEKIQVPGRGFIFFVFQP